MKPNAKGKTAYDLVTDADAKAALRSRPFIFFLSDRRTIVQQLLTVCTLGVSPSLVSRWREGYSFWSS